MIERKKLYNEHFLDQAQPFANAIETILKLSQSFKVEIVSSRLNSQYTSEWLKNELEKITYTVIEHTSKPGYYARGNYEIVFEDCLENVLDAIDLTTNQTLFVLMDSPWNQHANLRNLTRVSSWIDFSKLVKNH